MPPVTQVNISSPANETLFSDAAMGSAVDAVKASSATVYYLIIDNSLNAAASYVKLFNQAAGGITLGTTVPDEVIYVAPNAKIVQTFTSGPGVLGKVFGSALAAACVTTGGTAGVTAPIFNVPVVLAYS